MTVKHYLAASTLLAMTPLSALADSGAERLTEMLEPVKTYVAEFDQEILDSGGQQLQEATGQMWLARPGRFRWEVEAPYEQVVVSDGEKVTMYDPDLQQATIQPLDERVTHTPALLLSGSADELTESYEVTSSQQGTAETFTLTPKSADTLFESLKMTFYGEELGQLQMTDSTGQRTAIEFDNVEQNAEIADSRFALELPEDTDVIQQSP